MDKTSYRLRNQLSPYGIEHEVVESSAKAAMWGRLYSPILTRVGSVRELVRNQVVCDVFNRH